MVSMKFNRNLAIKVIAVVSLLGIVYVIYESNYIQMFSSNPGVMIQQMNVNGNIEKSRNWIIVTTIKSPSKDIEKLAKIKGWKVLVVGDNKTPTNWNFSGCIFLGIDQQKDLGFRSAEYLPTNSYTRKNIGYLYAIQHGAQHIYDTDDDNHPTNGKITFYHEEFTTGLIYDDFANDVMNPYAHFGQPTIWPRGYPLDFIDKPHNNTYKLCKLKTPAIQQGLVNGDPDLDAIFRLTRKLPNQQNINITFDPRAPPVILPEGVFAPFNSQNTFFTYDAFWALFLPTSVAFRVTDIWRGYWAQRLLWLLGHRLSFLPPNAVQFRNSHDYLKDFQDENQFYVQTNSLIEFLKSWTCDAAKFFQCVSQLSHNMADAAFWDRSDAELIDLWLSDLSHIGYKEPEMVNQTIAHDCNDTDHRVYFSPASQNNQKSSVDDIYNFCHDDFNDTNIEEMSTIKESQQKPSIIYEDLLLIIIFNFPFYRNIPMLETLYKSHFPNMIYCGQAKSYELFVAEMKEGPLPWRESQVSFLNITMSSGYYAYECVIRAIQMNYNVKGYIALGDDVLFNFWNLKSINLKNANFLVRGLNTQNITVEKVGWMWWGSKFGKVPTIKAMEELEIMAKNATNVKQRNRIKKYIENRYEANLNMTIVHFASGDQYFIPKSLSDMFVDVMSVFLKHKVFLEIAVPITLAGLSPVSLTEGFLGRGLWGGNRKTPFKFYNSTTHFLHPIKFAQLFKDNVTSQAFCNNYIYDLMMTYNIDTNIN